jgi:hypothetical protein
MTAGWNDDLEMTSTMTTYQHIFETVMFVSMVWTEESFDNSGLSLGYYDIFKSYFYVPRGIDLPSAELQQRGHSLYDRDTVHMRGVMEGDAYYQMRISELENRLRDLEETRTILPREEIRDIHAGRAEVGNRPIPSEYFDADIFEV